MFRKPKRSAKKAGLRKKTSDGDEQNQGNNPFGGIRPNAVDSDGDSNDDGGTALGLQEARKRAKLSGSAKKNNTISSSSNKKEDGGPILHPNQVAPTEVRSQKEKATAINEYHPVDSGKTDPNRNKFLAQPIRAAKNVRVTCRFDYQPDVCKDYKDTGFCGFGDTCIYLHDRGDTLSGWQFDKKWEEDQAKKKKEKDRQIEAFLGEGNGDSEDEEEAATKDDDFPFACFLCRKAFEDPVVTPCGHYFCQSCLHKQNKDNDNQCPICKKDTHGVMNQPTKLIKHKRKLLGRNATWQEFMDNAKKKRSS